MTEKLKKIDKNLLVKRPPKKEKGGIGVVYLGDIKPSKNYAKILNDIVSDPEEKRNTIADLMQLRKEIVEEFDEELDISKKDFKLDIHKFRLVTSAEIAEKLSFVMENCAVIEDYSGAGVQIEFL